MSGFPSRFRTLTAVLCLASLQLGTTSGLAQAPPPAPNRLFIQVLDGEGALNDVRGRTAREPIVQIEDENHKPIAGALVIFTVPNSGAGATFANGLTTFQTTTLADGKAIATGFKPNGVSGSYQIQVHATYGNLSSDSVINQTNVASPSSTPAVHAARAFPLKAIAIVAAVAAGAVAAGILATRGGQHSDTVTPGTPTVGAP
jgi:hypothetical protein